MICGLRSVVCCLLSVTPLGGDCLESRLTQVSCVGAHGCAPYKPWIKQGLWAHSRAPLQALIKSSGVLRQSPESSSSVPERFSGLEGMLNSFQRLPFSTQREKGLPLKVQQVLLRNRGRMIKVTSREDVGKFFSNQ